MARAELTVTLNHMRTAVKAMRELGVASWIGSPLGDLHLGPPPPVRETESPEKDENASRRQYYNEVLGRGVTDAELKNLP